MIFKMIPKKRICTDLLLTIIWGTFNINFIKIVSKLVETYTQTNPAITLVLAYFAFLICWEINEYIADVHMEVTSSVIEGNTRTWALGEIYRLKQTTIKELNTGYINGVVSKYIRQATDFYNRLILCLPISIIYICYCIVKMWSFNYIFGVSLVGLLVCAVLARYLFNGIKEDEILTEYEGTRDKLFIDSVANIGTIQKMRARSFIQRFLDENIDKCNKQTRRWSGKREIGFTLYKLLIYCYMPVACFLYLSNPDRVTDKVSFFSFLSVIAIQLVHSSQEIARFLIVLSRYNAVKKKLVTIFSDENKKTHTLKIDEFRNAQIFNVEYKYKHKDHDNDITVTIPYFQLNRGDKVCLYGESGQGKSTLLNILSGELETNGVLVNGQQTKERLECVFITQDTEILDMSLRDNLTLGNNDITDKEIENLIRQCGLGEWYDSQPEGLETLLGERGTHISVGQKQRLNIIRGLLVKNKEVYLLDEPTSNVDEATEEKLIEVIKEYLADKTMVVVTHRPKIKEICNKAYKFTNGTLGMEEKL